MPKDLFAVEINAEPLMKALVKFDELIKERTVKGIDLMLGSVTNFDLCRVSSSASDGVITITLHPSIRLTDLICIMEATDGRYS